MKIIPKKENNGKKSKEPNIFAQFGTWGCRRIRKHCTLVTKKEFQAQKKDIKCIVMWLVLETKIESDDNKLCCFIIVPLLTEFKSRYI